MSNKKGKEYKVGDEFFIKGKALYCFTTRPNRKGNMPSNCYEVGVTEAECDYNIDAFITDTVIKDKEGNEKQIERLKIANSKYPIPMFDCYNERLERPVVIPNDTPITLFVKVKHTEQYNRDYLVCRAIKLNEEVKEFNPFR